MGRLDHGSGAPPHCNGEPYASGRVTHAALQQEVSMIGRWLKLSTEATMLAVEAHGVIAMRLAQIAVGRGSPAETQLMVTEKMRALAQAAATMATGGSAQKVVRGYRKTVRA